MCGVSINRARHKRGQNKYGLLTKCEVKMAGYWPSFFFCMFVDRDGKTERIYYMIFGEIFLAGQGG